MKCGRDMGGSKSPDIQRDIPADPSTFTPIVEDEYARLAPTARVSKGPVADVASYKEAAAAAAAALQEQQEMESASAPDASAAAAAASPGIPAARGTDRGKVTADFAVRKQFCERCGMANPHDQKFCKNCGSALGESPGGMADETFASSPAALEDSVPVETTTLADVSPSSAYSTAGPGPESARAPRRAPRTPPVGGIREWGVREWLALTIAVIVLVFMIWFAFFGGYGMFFNSRNRNIRKAGAVMENLGGFMFQISATYETEAGQYPGSGHVLFESPASTAWEIRRDTPGNPQVQGTISVGTDTWSGAGGVWKLADPATSAGDIALMWRQFRASEGMNDEEVAGHPCLHYKYRMDPTLMKTVLGLGGQDTVSDAIVETWIDKTSFQVLHQTVEIFGAQIDGARTRISLVMDLAETGKTYGIKPPL